MFCIVFAMMYIDMKKKKHLYAAQFLLLIENTTKQIGVAVHGHCHCDSDQQR